MKKKFSAALCVLMCIMLVLSTFAACSVKRKNTNEDATTLAPEENWQAGADQTYAPVNITSMELADLVNEALGAEAANFNGDLNTLTGEQKERVKQLAQAKGYTVTQDASGNTVIQKEDLPTEPAKQEEVNNILSSASVSDLSNISPSDYSRIYQAAKDNGATAVSKEDGSVEIVKTVTTTARATTPVSRRVTTTAGNGTTAGNQTTLKPAETTTRHGQSTALPTYRPVPTSPPLPAGTTLSSAQFAQPAWVTTSNMGGSTVLNNIVMAKDGGVVTAGTTVGDADSGNADGSGVVLKYDAKGKQLWKDTVKGNKSVMINDVAVLTDGSVIAVGETMATDLVQDSLYKCKDTVEGILVKYSASGNRQWIKIIGGSGADEFYSVAATPDGGFVAGGSSSSVDLDMKNVGTSGSNKAFCFKFDNNGNIAWKTAVAGNRHCSVDGLAVNSAGTVFSSVTAYCVDGDFASLTGTRAGRRYSVAMSLTPAGQIAWATAICDNGAIHTPSVAVSPDGGCVLAGFYSCNKEGNTMFLKDIFNGGNIGTYDGLAVKFNSQGGVAWITTLVGFESDYIYDIAPVKDGYAVTGYSKSSNRDFGANNNGNYDGYMYIIGEYGDKQTRSSFGGSESDTPRGVCTDGANKVYVCGMTNSGDGFFASAPAKGTASTGVGLVAAFDVTR
ncbi:MAG: hypothetical protein IJK64_04945 [Clostridia bacterium]|nr:hypothetical protein [Clostridia bacterium]